MNTYLGPISVGVSNNQLVASALAMSPLCPQMPQDDMPHVVTVSAGDNDFVAIHIDTHQIGGYFNLEGVSEEVIVEILLNTIGIEE